MISRGSNTDRAFAGSAQPAERSVYLSFYIEGEEYAIPILRVREVVEFDCLTKVPNMPVSIRGLMNLRGNVVPVVDLALKFGLTEAELTKWTCVVIVEVELDNEPTTIGIVADAVGQVIELFEQDKEPPPAFGTRIRVDYLLGMGKTGKKFVLILDIDRVLSSDELMAVDALQATAPETDTISGSADEPSPEIIRIAGKGRLHL